jgi:hypothetical protein
MAHSPTATDLHVEVRAEHVAIEDRREEVLGPAQHPALAGLLDVA